MGNEYEHAQRRQRTEIARIERASSRHLDAAAKRQVQARGLSRQTLQSGMAWHQVLSMCGFNYAAALEYWDEQRNFESNPGGQAWNGPPPQAGGPYPQGPGPQEWQAHDIYQRRREEEFVEQVEQRMAWEMYDDMMHRMATSMKDALWEQHQEELRKDARRAAERERRNPHDNDPRDR